MRRRNWGLAGILLGMSASVLMQTLVATAMPTIAQEIGGMALYSWVFGAYMLASTITLPLFAKLADRFGRRPLYLGGMLVFLTGSLLAASSTSMLQLVGWRAVQGLGAGAVAPAALAAVGDLFDESRRGRVFGLLGLVQIMANLLGPALGGWITDQWSWRWGFWIVLPPGLLALLCAVCLPGQAEQHAPAERLIGVLPLADMLCSTLLGLQALGPGHSAAGLGLTPGACPGLIAWRCSGAGDLVPPPPAGPPSPGNIYCANLLPGILTYTTIAYLPPVQAGRRLSPGAGAVLLPMMLTAGRQRSRRLVGRCWPHCTAQVAGWRLWLPSCCWLCCPAGRLCRFGACPGRVGHGAAAARLSAKRTAHCRPTGARRCQQPGTTGPQPGWRHRRALVGRLADPRPGAGARFTRRLPFAGPRRGWRNFP
jgi:multidrug resistance protein